MSQYHKTDNELVNRKVINYDDLEEGELIEEEEEEIGHNEIDDNYLTNKNVFPKSYKLKLSDEDDIKKKKIRDYKYQIEKESKIKNEKNDKDSDNSNTKSKDDEINSNEINDSSLLFKNLLESKRKSKSIWEENDDEEESHQKKKRKKRTKKYSKTQSIHNSPEQLDVTDSPYSTKHGSNTPLHKYFKNNVDDYQNIDRSRSSSPVGSVSSIYDQDLPSDILTSNTHRVTQSYPTAPALVSCRSVDNYEKLNRIEEGAYGVVYRARDKETGEIIALKKLKLDKEKFGFPTTSLREIQMLLMAKHPNIVNVKEIAIGSNINKVFIAMEFVEHDLKSLMEEMEDPFLQSEIKTIMLQLLSAVALLHSYWIIHRDLKTSNILMNNKGQIKLADFGLARRFGSSMNRLTPLVVTLWYRAPELLLGEKNYTKAIDMWSVGCIFAELINKAPLFPGTTEIEQLSKIFKLLGTPNEKIWPGFDKLSNARTINFGHYKYNNIRSRFPYLSEKGLDLMSKLLTYDPKKRITAEEALKHPYFKESPLPKDPSLFPTFPSKASGEKRKVYLSPSAPKGQYNNDSEEIESSLFGYQSQASSGFRLKI
ncbi:Pkinase-domain-containing protein [Anaeromyces robustus]|uniref:cyclin-dependent kinase n=1 Tax=Anaeromyces robustus TaxID=1754192 RepID=A0A1Y1W1D0_9FUNG|nr:Pkinase-domain-containing protein [Anaeromyces robustus]|eukprot:ORX67343.1 Pkinase-domain-containing protein [Anaeromyces robustus]